LYNIIIVCIYNDEVINNNYGRLQDLILLFKISKATWKYFFEIYRQLGMCPQKGLPALIYGIPVIMAADTDMNQCIIRKVMPVIRNNGGRKFHNKISVLPHYPQPCSRRKSQNLKPEKLSRPLRMWVSIYNTETLPVSKNYLTFQNSKHMYTVCRCIYTALFFKYNYYSRYWYFSQRCILRYNQNCILSCW
jgi:hypothetical protein